MNTNDKYDQNDNYDKRILSHIPLLLITVTLIYNLMFKRRIVQKKARNKSDPLVNI